MGYSYASLGSEDNQLTERIHSGKPRPEESEEKKFLLSWCAAWRRQLYVSKESEIRSIPMKPHPKPQGGAGKWGRLSIANEI